MRSLSIIALALFAAALPGLEYDAGKARHAATKAVFEEAKEAADAADGNREWGAYFIRRDAVDYRTSVPVSQMVTVKDDQVPQVLRAARLKLDQRIREEADARVRFFNYGPRMRDPKERDFAIRGEQWRTALFNLGEARGTFEGLGGDEALRKLAAVPAKPKEKKPIVGGFVEAAKPVDPAAPRQ